MPAKAGIQYQPVVSGFWIARSSRAMTSGRLCERRRVEAVAAVAELAGDPHLAVDHHVLQIFAGEAPQQLFHALARSAAIGLEIDRSIGAHLLLVKQPVEQPVWRQQRIEQLVILDGLGKRAGPHPIFLLEITH